MRQGPMVRGGRRSTALKLGERAKERLDQAHSHYKEGAHAEAAAAFEQMASTATKRDMPRVAAHLATKGAAAAAMAGDQEGLDRLVEVAVTAARSNADSARAARDFGAMIHVIESSPLADQAPALQERLRERLGVTPKSAKNKPTVNRAMRRGLPKSCPTCGCKVEAEACQWNDDGSVDCGACSSPLKG